MSLSIGLEALNRRVVVTGVSLESMYADTMEAYADMMDGMNHVAQLSTALENLYAVRKSVKKFGFSKSLESLLGHQLGSTSNQILVSVEENKKSVWQRILSFLRAMLRYVQDFFAKALNTRRGVMLKLKAIVNSKDGYEFKKDAEIAAYEFKDLTEIEGVLSNTVSSGTYNEDALKLPESPKLDTSVNIKTYANRLVLCLQKIDNAEKAIKNNINNSIKQAQQNINKPKEDTASASEIRNATNKYLKNLAGAVKAVFKSARAFMKGIKKKKEKK